MKTIRSTLGLWTLLSLVACGSDHPGGGGGGAGSGGGDGSGTCQGQFSLAWKGTCAVAPTMPARRSVCRDGSGITDYCADDGVLAPVLGCLGQTATAPASRAITLKGHVRVFSGGGDSTGVKLDVYKATDLGSADALGRAAPIGGATTTITQADVDAGNVRACPTKDVPGNPPCARPDTDCSSPCQTMLGASGAQYCSKGVCVDRLRYEAPYQIPSVPSDTPLAVRAAGPMGTSDGKWAPLVSFRVIASSADPRCATEQSVDCWEDAAKTEYRFQPVALSRSDYQIIPTSAGLSSGIPTGKGVVAGEVRDCQNVRIEFAEVGLNPPATSFTYFNDNPFKTLPNAGRLSEGTDGLGLFAGLSIAPGAVKVAALGQINGDNAALGEADVVVFPDTVTIVLLNGGRPIP